MPIEVKRGLSRLDLAGAFKRHLGMAAIAACMSLATSGERANAAISFCMSPRAPSLYATKPSKPYCAALRNCSTWEVEQYRSRLNSYFEDVQQYLVDVDKFRKLAYEYADCEAKAD